MRRPNKETNPGSGENQSSAGGEEDQRQEGVDRGENTNCGSNGPMSEENCIFIYLTIYRINFQ